MEGLELPESYFELYLKGWRRTPGKVSLAHDQRWWKLRRCGLCGLRVEGLKQLSADLTARNSCRFNLLRRDQEI